MKCWECGTEVFIKMKLCPQCGRKVGFDKELINAAKTGNEEAITDLYNRTYNSVYQAIRTFIKDEDTILDIEQDTFLKAFDSLEQLDKPENFRAWIKRIAINKSKDWLKKKKPLLFSEMEAADSEEEIDFPDEKIEYQPEAVADREETKRLLWEIIDSLSDEQRLVVGMYYFQDIPVKEIAESVDCSENTVKSRLNYARKNIETKVRELEKKGTKLYSMTPIAFLLGLFRSNEAQAAELPSLEILNAIEQKYVKPKAGIKDSKIKNQVANEAGVKAGKAVAGATGKSVVVKVIVGIVAGAVIIGGVIAGIIAYKNNQETQEISTENTEAIITEDTEAISIEDTEAIGYVADEKITAQHFQGYYESDNTNFAIQIIPIDDTTATVELWDISQASTYNVTGEATISENSLTLVLFKKPGVITLDYLYDEKIEAEDSDDKQVSGIYQLKSKERVEREETEESSQMTGIEQLNGRFVRGQQILVIEVISQDTASILLMDNRNGGVATYIDDFGYYKDGILSGEASYAVDVDVTKIETVKIHSVDSNTIYVDMSEDMQSRLNANLAGEYYLDTNSALTSENADTDLISRFTGRYISEYGQVKMEIEKNGDLLSATIGDDLVMGYSTRTYTSVEESSNSIICVWEHGTDIYTIDEYGSVTLDTGGFSPEIESEYLKAER